MDLKRANWIEFFRWLFGKRQRFRVAGDSMLPLLKPGDEVLTDPAAYHHQNPRPGDLVIAQHPLDRKLRVIKRVASVTSDQLFILRGDNLAESTDSRVFGPVSKQHILAKVSSRFG